MNSKARIRMDALNIVFGIIGIVSFGYAIWQNRSAESARQITKRVTENIRELAREAARLSVGSPTEGYARSIVQIANSLIGEHNSNATREVGVVRIDYLAAQLRSRIAEVTLSSDSIFGHVYRGKYVGSRWTEDTIPPNLVGVVPQESVLVYGPYRNLPVRGAYKAEFRLRRDPMERISSEPFLRLDVYCFERNEMLAVRYLSNREVVPTWQVFPVYFFYPDPDIQLEYRVAIMVPGVDVAFEFVTAESDIPERSNK
jgi:hypothetical protein